ncbi:hypothetical protein PV08_03087 [Exophiala spinifera]|uniref:Fe2OG dioxygenase domain-containing protein n=1 Tax=Exophiala spinifera TaxID=91928 RepID=A0A0D2BIN6_9EURO|nr:uncharacterized protein PV08_03087 [Exophiala spinifera]KIW18798.1 hypothetical protein PV08_03087 [Exophiala spinifera]
MKPFGFSLSFGFSFSLAVATFADQLKLSLAHPPEPDQQHLQLDCTHPAYKIHFLSRDPIVVYIENFLTPFERDHLLKTSGSSFINSQTADQDGTETLRSTRRSKSATVTRDAVTRCIEERALIFQGFDTPPSHLEPLQLVRYHVNETYDLHTDWFTSPAQATTAHGGNRLTSFFAYVTASADISGGGTNFPLLDPPADERWCEYIDCDVPLEDGVTFLPVPGNAVFWVNLVGGKGDPRNIHSGVVVTSGEKVGLNIWTREGPLSPRFRGEDVDDDEGY